MAAFPVLTAPAAAEFERTRGAAAERGGGLSLDEAVSLVHRRVGGRVLAAGRVQADGRMVYRIKILTRGGVVRIIYVDPRSGRLM